MASSTEYRLAQAMRRQFTLERAHERAHDKLRRLEREVRLHVNRECECASERECLVMMARLLPRRPRPTLRELRRAALTRSKRLDRVGQV